MPTPKNKKSAIKTIPSYVYITVCYSPLTGAITPLCKIAALPTPAPEPKRNIQIHATASALRKLDRFAQSPQRAIILKSRRLIRAVDRSPIKGSEIFTFLKRKKTLWTTIGPLFKMCVCGHKRFKSWRNPLADADEFRRLLKCNNRRALVPVIFYNQKKETRSEFRTERRPVLVKQ